MEALFAALLGFFFFVDHGGDPAHDAWQGRRALRELECTRMPQLQAHRLHPGRVPAPGARAETAVQADALVCTRRLVPFGERAPRDELIMSSLGETIAQFVQLASAFDTPTTTWHVEGFYPDVDIATRIANAARTELAARSRPEGPPGRQQPRVVNQAPLLAAGDLLVLRQLEPKDAFALACERYFAEGTLTGDDALLAIALVDEHESALHAGVCQRGGWRWLQ